METQNAHRNMRHSATATVPYAVTPMICTLHPPPTPLAHLRNCHRVQHLSGEGEGLLVVSGVHVAGLLHAHLYHVHAQESKGGMT